MDNMYRYQGAYSEFEEETGWNDFELRTYDAQIGRWTGVDPYQQFPGSYNAMGNNPASFVDEDGGWTVGGWGGLIGAVAGGTAGYFIAKANGGSDLVKGLAALGGGLVGAGIGYGAGNSLFADPDAFAHEADFFTSVRAFYKGFFGGSTGVTSATGFAHSPTIWNLPAIGSLNISLPSISLPNISLSNIIRWQNDVARIGINRLIYNIDYKGRDTKTGERLGNVVNDGSTTHHKWARNALVINNLQLPNIPADCPSCQISVNLNGPGGDVLNGPANPIPGSRINLKVTTDDMGSDPFGRDLLFNLEGIQTGRFTIKSGVTVRLMGKGTVPARSLKILGVKIIKVRK